MEDAQPLVEERAMFTPLTTRILSIFYIAIITGVTEKELRCKTTPNRHALLPSMGLVLLAARANGLVALDGVHLDLEDSKGFEAAAQVAKEMGYDGKTLIHPKVGAKFWIFLPYVQRLTVDLSRADCRCHEQYLLPFE